MITQKIIHNKDTGKIIQFQEYKDNVLCIEELYNEDNMLIQIHKPIEDSLTKLFFDDEYWYVFKKNLSKRKYSYRITKYVRKDSHNNYNANPIETNVISLGSALYFKRNECTQLCTPITNDKGIKIIKELYKKEMLQRHNLLDIQNKNNRQKIIFTNWHINER